MLAGFLPIGSPILLKTRSVDGQSAHVLLWSTTSLGETITTDHHWCGSLSHRLRLGRPVFWRRSQGGWRTRSPVHGDRPSAGDYSTRWVVSGDSVRWCWRLVSAGFCSRRQAQDSSRSLWIPSTKSAWQAVAAWSGRSRSRKQSLFRALTAHARGRNSTLRFLDDLNGSGARVVT